MSEDSPNNSGNAMAEFFVPQYPSQTQSDIISYTVAQRDEMGTQSLVDQLQQDVQALKNSVTLQNHQVEEYRQIVAEITILNHELYKHVGTLTGRISHLERSEIRFGEMRGREHDASYQHTSVAHRRGLGSPFKPLRVLVRGEDVGHSQAIGLPTPATPTGPSPGLSADFDTILGFPRPAVSPLSARKSQTFLYKRGVHNLSSQLPPEYVQLPFLPLTDAELVIFFFNCVRRPIVALRLYARDLGPSSITNLINEYRTVLPDGYQKNTCSVKCTTSIRRGVEEWGESWKLTWERFFKDANDAQATDAIRIKGEEIPLSCDFKMFDLLHGLKKLPESPHGGIFTQCAQWCKDNKKNLPLSAMGKLGVALEYDQDPTDNLAPELFLLEENNTNNKMLADDCGIKIDDEDSCEKVATDTDDRKYAPEIDDD